MTIRIRSTNKLSPTFVLKVKWDDPANPKDGKKAKNKHTDGDGMYLLVKKPSPNSKDTPKYWHMDYYRPVSKKRNTLSFGKYGDVGLGDARDKRDAARKLIASGIDPAEHREEIKQQKLSEHANTFEVLAAEFLAIRAKESGKANKDVEIKRRLDHDVLPYIGKMPFTKITTVMLEDKVTKRIVDRDALSIAKKVKSDLKQIFDIPRGRRQIPYNPASDINIPKYKGGNYKAITDPDELVHMLRDIWNSYENEKLTFIVAQLVKLSVLNFQRPGEMRSVQWSNYKPQKKWVEITAFKTEDRDETFEHIVPLARQSIEILESLHPLTGDKGYVFYSGQGEEPFYSENTVNDALEKLGYRGRQTAHGLRATATTILHEVLGEPAEHINMQLAHVVKDPNGTAYFRTKFLKSRVNMIKKWADYIDDLLNGTKNVPVIDYDNVDD